MLPFDPDQIEEEPWKFALATLAGTLATLDSAARIEALNVVRRELHSISPMKSEPVDCVQWVRQSRVQANDYNPNAVAPPEMELLRHSIASDGYTQPIVTWAAEADMLEVVDGFHRHRVGKECPEVAERIHGYLPVVIANEDRTDRGDRIAATIRHNRARGKHRIDGMSAIVVELKRRNWSDAKIGKELGMEPDEVLRLAQITGLAEMFADREFSEAWEAGVSDTIDETDSLDVNDEGGDAESK
jgi:ParB-like chromosome segregation protein Spo0J